MRALASAGAGFLLAVLWFDLMFDVQVRGRADSADATDATDAVASTAAYYRRVTTDASPMNRLVALAMLVTAGAIVGELLQGDVRTWVAAASLVLAAGPMTMAGIRTVPSAVRLGTQRDTPDEQFDLARAILRQHLVCIVGIAGVLVLQLGFGG